MSKMASQIPSELLRDVIREVIQDVVAAEVGAVVNEGRVAPVGSTVVISNQADLDEAIRRIIADAAHPARRAAMLSGKVRFLLGSETASGSARTSAGRGIGQANQTGQPHRLDRGALTERHVRAAGQAGATVITISARVVVTPLAKERARAMGVTIVKEG